jgi:tetratricopeptide (TPR) repeat protein
MLRACFAIFLAATSLGGAHAGDQTVDQRLLADAGDGRLDDIDFPAACLIAGGARDPIQLAELHSRWADLRQRADRADLGHLPALEQAKALHARMHAEILVGRYCEVASDPGQSLLAGDYNCLSAAAIYWDLCDQAGIGLEIWSRPGHVYLRDPDSGEIIEPASKQWRGRSPASASTLPATTARRIAPLALIGKFYYNRGLALLQQGNHSSGLACIRASLRLDPADREARGNLLAGINNWAAALCEQQRFREARLLIDQGLAIDSRFPPLVANARYVRARTRN